MTALDPNAQPAPHPSVAPAPPDPQDLEKRRFRAVRSLGTWMLRLCIGTVIAVIVVTVISSILLVGWGWMMTNRMNSADGEFPVLLTLVPLLASLASSVGSLLLLAVGLAFVILGIIAAVRARGRGRAGALLAIIPLVLGVIVGGLFYIIVLAGAALAPEGDVTNSDVLLGGLGIGALLVYVITPLVCTVTAIVGSVMVRSWGRRELAAAEAQAR